MAKAGRSMLLMLTILLTAALTLSACGGKSEGGGSDSGSKGSDKPVELIWYTIGAAPKDLDRVMEEANKYTKEKIGATVKINMIDWGDYDQKMKVMTASGTPMDMMFTASYAFDYVQNARKGAFMELDGLLPTYGQDLLKELDPQFLEGSKVDGHNYAIPANKELPAQNVWRFNKGLLDKYSLDISNVYSLESLEPLLKTVKENEPDYIPFALLNTYVPPVPYDYLIQYLPMAVALDTQDYKVVNVLETPEMKQALATMHKYYKAGYLSKEVSTTKSKADLNKSGKWLVDFQTTQPLADNLWTTTLGYPVVSTPNTDPVLYNWSVTGSMQAISAHSEHPEKAMEYLNLLNTDSYLRNLLGNGIENVHYQKVGDNKIKKLPEAQNYVMSPFTLGNLMITYLDEADPDDKWDQFKEFNKSGIPSPLFGFNLDTSNLTTEIAAIQNVKEEFWAALMTGTVDPDVYLPKAIEKFKAAGLDKIMDEAQRQIDDWRASKS